MYGQDEGNLTALLREASTSFETPEVSIVWNTISHGVRNWQFQQIEMIAARNISVSAF